MEESGEKDESSMLVEPQMRSDRAYLDLGCGVTQLLTENRLFRRRNDWRDRSFLEPSEAHKRFLLPPSEHRDQPESGLASRYCHTSINKIRHPVYAVSWSPEGRRLITASQNGELTLWNAFGFIADKTIGGQNTVRDITWSHSGEYMITGDMDGVIKYWNPQMRLLKEFSGHTGPVRGLSFCPTDLKFVSGSDDVTLKIWDFANAKEEMVLRGHGFDVKACEWHPSKSLILSGSRDNLVKLWNPRTGKELCSLGGHKNSVSVVRWNPCNGNWFMTASRDKTVRIYDLRFLRKEDPCLFTMQGHTTEVYSAAWHPQHESLLATGGYDGALFFWMVNGADKEGHAQAVVPAAHEGSIWSMGWAPAGHLLCTGSQDKTAKFWSRMRPGMNDLLLYKGYQRSVDELDMLRAMHQAPPTLEEYEDFEQQKQTEAATRQEVQELERNAKPEPLQVDTVLNIGQKYFDRTLSQYQLQRNLATEKVPGLEGEVGMDQAVAAVGFNLVPPQIFYTFNDGTNYDPEPDTNNLLAALKSGILARQQDAMAMGRRENVSQNDAGGNFAGGGRMGRMGFGRDAAPVDPKKLPEPRSTGYVRMFDDTKGFGFIRPHDAAQGDLFLQKNDILPGYGKGGEQRFDKNDVVVFRIEEGENRNTGQMQKKARQVVLGDHDPERVSRNRDQSRGGSGRGGFQSSRGGYHNASAPPPRGGGYQSRVTPQQYHSQAPPRMPPPRGQGGYGGVGDGGPGPGGYDVPPMPPPPSRGYGAGPPGQPHHPPPPSHHHHHGGGGYQRPPGYGQVTPALFEELNRHASDQARLDQILAYHGVTREMVQRAIEEQQRM